MPSKVSDVQRGILHSPNSGATDRPKSMPKIERRGGQLRTQYLINVASMLRQSSDTEWAPTHYYYSLSYGVRGHAQLRFTKSTNEIDQVRIQYKAE